MFFGVKHNFVSYETKKILISYLKKQSILDSKVKAFWNFGILRGCQNKGAYKAKFISICKHGQPMRMQRRQHRSQTYYTFDLINILLILLILLLLSFSYERRGELHEKVSKDRVKIGVC
jgi:hypothetical protein